jgi:ammonium transporter Rh
MFLITTANGKQLVLDANPVTAGVKAQEAYSMFTGIEIMMFVGFGYLMTFMKHYGVSAVGFTMLITALGLQWAVLTEAFCHQWVHLNEDGLKWHYINVDIYALMGALFAISSVLITFGALIGKISPKQMIIITFVELFCHSVSYKMILGKWLKVSDMGGTYIDHMFGAYFGLAVSYMLPKPTSEPADYRSSDLFSLIGTVFLWIYWPSFVSGAAEPGSAAQQMGIVNTILALSSSTIAAFILSSFYDKEGKLRPVDIQNATLAGGVSIGCVANMNIHCGGAIGIGFVAGAVSTYGFNVIQEKLENFGIHDTCGVHNLHAIPSIIGAVASVIVCLIDNDNVDVSGDLKTAKEQWWRQLVGMLATLFFAIVTGLLVGYVCNKAEPNGTDTDFHDGAHWKIAAGYEEKKKNDSAAYGAVATGGEVEMAENSV